MCATTTDVRVTIAADLSHTGSQRTAIKKIDTCISDIVEALEFAGITMRSSCCGHKRGPGEILLQDGRRLIVESDG